MQQADPCVSLVAHHLSLTFTIDAHCLKKGFEEVSKQTIVRESLITIPRNPHKLSRTIQTRKPDIWGTGTADDFITMLAPSTRVNCGCITTKAREEGANMIIIGVDFHPSMQEIAFLDQETGEYVERQLNHSDGEAEKFYREMAARGPINQSRTS
jgi:hypothetical protein